MRYCYLLIFTCFNLFNASSQVNEGLTAEERAYLFHVVKKSPILNNNFGRYFDYTGPEITFHNGSLNYDSVEILIINNPELLVIHKGEIAKSSKGLIAEASNKMALWELNKTLLAKRSNPNDLKEYKNEYARFEELLMEKLPSNAQKIKNEEVKPHPRLDQVMNPGLAFNDKSTHLESMRFLTVDEQIQTLDAINYAINEYVSERTLEIFRSLGGETDEFVNVLVAAGDGSGTTGLLEEREKDEKGRWNKGLPKAIGLFPYELKKVSTEEKRKIEESIEPMRWTINDFETAGGHRYTNVHFDVWGYNGSKQTTVILEKNGLSYHLFGSEETRFLSPDSSFSSGQTFQSVINDLQSNYIDKVWEKIYGKKGYDDWIDYNKKKKDQTELKIEKCEKEYSDLGYTPITTSSKPSRRVKRSKRKAIKAGASTFNGHPTTNSNKKERKKLQNEIIYLYGLFENYTRKIKELEVKKQEAIDLMAIYQRRMDTYQELIGRNWASYTEENGMYIFEDSTTFDLLTQEFQFKPTEKKESFEVRLLAIPFSALSDQADEVMLHMNIMDAIPDYDARINLQLNDVFDSDEWELKEPLLKKEDSVALMVFFEGLLNKKVDFNVIARGQGVGKWNGSNVIKAIPSNELSSYPSSKMDSNFVRLRKSEVLIQLDRHITLEINSFTDPIKASFPINEEELLDLQSRYKLTKNDILSGYRTATIMKALKNEINILAGTYLNREDASYVIDRFNKAIQKTKVSIGPGSVPQKVFH